MGQLFIVFATFLIYFSWRWTASFLPDGLPLDVLNIYRALGSNADYMRYDNSIGKNELLFFFSSMIFAGALGVLFGVLYKLIKGDYLMGGALKRDTHTWQSLFIANAILLVYIFPVSFIIAERDLLLTIVFWALLAVFATVIMRWIMLLDMSNIYPLIIIFAPIMVFVLSIVEIANPHSAVGVPLAPTPNLGATAPAITGQLTQTPTPPSGDPIVPIVPFNPFQGIIEFISSPVFNGIGTVISLLTALFGAFSMARSKSRPES